MESLSVASFVPDIELPSTQQDTTVSLRESGGKTTVLVTVHSASCTGCQSYLSALAPLSDEFDIWDARLLVIVPGSISEAARVTSPFGKVLADGHERVAGPASASLIVADRYGHVFEAVSAGESHNLPSPRDLDEWLKFLGTLCPE